MQYNCRDSGSAAGGEPSESTGVSPKTKAMNVIRTINLKLLPEGGVEKLLDDYVDFYSLLHDMAVNRYIKSGRIKPLGIEGAKKNYLTPSEKEEFRKELRSLGCSGTFIDLAIGQSGAEAYYKAKLSKARKEILFRDRIIRKLEGENPNLLKPNSLWFNLVNNGHGTCAMCGKKGDMPYQSHKPEYKDEYLCDVCALDFFRFRKQVVGIKNRVLENYFLCKKIAEEKKVSKSMLRLLKRFKAPVISLKNTVSDKALIKKFVLKVNFEKQLITMKSHSGETMQIKFCGEHYYSNYPKYGYMADVNKYSKLVAEFIENGGYPSLLRSRKNGATEFYLSIPTHYPAPREKLPVLGYVIVSSRSVLLYIDGVPEFIKLYKIYLKKRIYESKRARVLEHNNELLAFDWNQVPKRKGKLLKSLKNKLGLSLAGNPEVFKSEDGRNIRISTENLTAEISLDENRETATLTSNGDTRTLYVEDVPSRLKDYRKLNIYLQKPLPMPKKYTEGNLSNHIRHQNQVTARVIVEKVKEKLPEDASVVLIDYTYMHPEGENIVTPIIALSEQIKNMLQYDGMYGGAIPWVRLKELICPHCDKKLEKAENRLIIRDILLSKINSWICGCDHGINNSLIAVAKNIDNNLEELLKPLTPKEKKEGEIS